MNEPTTHTVNSIDVSVEHDAIFEGFRFTAGIEEVSMNRSIGKDNWRLTIGDNYPLWSIDEIDNLIACLMVAKQYMEHQP